jgi:glycosyltransferase involved in cell wall biosynthesis
VTSRLRVLLVEPYFSGSHRAWAEGYARHSAHDVELVTHHGSFWKWRMQGAALTLAHDIRALVAERGRPDVALVSDMVHLPALLGLAGDALAGVPLVLYLHENQLTYPLPPGEPRDLTYAVTNWLSMAAADEVWCNSAFHRDELLEELPRLLKHFPDHSHLPLLDDVAGRCRVEPVGVDLARIGPPVPPDPAEPPLLLWNQRWEYDKDPAALFRALDRLAGDGHGFQVAFCGETFALRPDGFDEAIDRLGDRVVHAGFAPEDEYLQLLRRAEVVVSTARHEFFGIAVVEAIGAGAFPVLPRRLSYPELLPAEHHDASLYDDERGLGDRLVWALADRERAATVADDLAAAVRRFDWPTVAASYDRGMARVVRG